MKIKTVNDLKNNEIDKNNYKNDISSYQFSNNFFLSPSNFEYKAIYQKKVNKLKKGNLIELDIKNLSNEKKAYFKNFITNNSNYKNKSLKSSKKIYKNFFKKCKSKEDLKETETLLKKIFPDNKELNKYSSLPFFFLTKKQINFSDDEKKNKKLLKEDFIYKISHGNRFFINKDNNNFIKNKSIKKGLSINYLKNNTNKKESSIPKLKLELNINNFKKQKQNEKIGYLSSKEKYFSFVKNKLSDLKNGNFLKQLEADIINFNEDNEILIDNHKDKNNFKAEYENLINKSITNKKKNIKKVKSCIDKLFYTINYFNYDNYNNNNYIIKKPFKYPINFYSSKQLEIKKKRYEKIHKEGWREFKRKINIRNLGYNSNKNIKNPMLLCVLEPSRNLQKKKIMTNKTIFLNDCRLRDLQISKKLKFEYSKEDMKRILNGQKPWNEIELNNKITADKNEKIK